MRLSHVRTTWIRANRRAASRCSCLLYTSYRLNVINIDLPTLRDRREDIPALINHFLDRFCRENEKYLGEDGRSLLRFEPDAMQLFLDHNWPGNVRELENVVERAVVLASSPLISVDVLPDYLVQASGIRTRPSENGAMPTDASRCV